MFIILAIYSKNLNSLTNFLKFIYKLKINKIFKLKFNIIQSQQKKKISFFSTLQSPHVNKKSQEQFEYYVQSKKLKIHVSQITKFLTIFKMIKTALFTDVKLRIEFLVDKTSFKVTPSNKIDYDKFKLKLKQKGFFFSSNATAHTSLKLLDISGEILLKFV